MKKKAAWRAALEREIARKYDADEFDSSYTSDEQQFEAGAEWYRKWSIGRRVSKGGKARMAKLTDEERKEFAAKGGRAKAENAGK